MTNCNGGNYGGIIPISQLPLALPLLGNEWAAVVQNGQTCKTPAKNIGQVGGIENTAVGMPVSLYYVASAGQTAFPLLAIDRFGNSWVLGQADTVRVFAGGNRLVPDDGTGMGGYTVNLNVVTLLYPAGPGEVISIDVLSPGAWTPPSNGSPGGGLVVGAELVGVAGLNTLNPLSYPPASFIFIFINNTSVFSAVDSPSNFTVTGNTINWNPHTYSINLGDQVVAFYNHS